MSIIVRGMEMPTDCDECRMQTDEGFCSAMPKEFCGYVDGQKHPGWCPLIELPEKHGRLIDENDVVDAIYDRLHELQKHKEFVKKHGDIDLLGVLPYIAKIQSVIKAEGGWWRAKDE